MRCITMLVVLAMTQLARAGGSTSFDTVSERSVQEYIISTPVCVIIDEAKHNDQRLSIANDGGAYYGTYVSGYDAHVARVIAGEKSDDTHAIKDDGTISILVRSTYGPGTVPPPTGQEKRTVEPPDSPILKYVYEMPRAAGGIPPAPKNHFRDANEKLIAFLQPVPDKNTYALVCTFKWTENLEAEILQAKDQRNWSWSKGDGALQYGMYLLGMSDETEPRLKMLVAVRNRSDKTVDGPNPQSVTITTTSLPRAGGGREELKHEMYPKVEKLKPGEVVFNEIWAPVADGKARCKVELKVTAGKETISLNPLEFASMPPSK